MIRAMVSADAAVVAALIRTAFGSITIRLDPPPSALRVSEPDILALLASGGGAVWDDAGIRGCILWQQRPGGLYLGRLAVDPDWQGRGIARLLLMAGEEEARRIGYVSTLLEVRLALPQNRRLFASAGYVERAERAHPGFTMPTYAEAEKCLVEIA
ncbi:MAG: GNAT family N-acetyltransferase [Janthinobacterium lividum]